MKKLVLSLSVVYESLEESRSVYAIFSLAILLLSYFVYLFSLKFNFNDLR
jgi:hypothetical protein